MHVRNAVARALPVFLLLLLAGFSCAAQDAAPQFAPLEHGVNDSVNKSSLNVNVRIPLAGTNGRGMGLNVALVNNSGMYVPSGSAWTSAPAQYNAGWNLSDNVFAAVADLSVPVGCTYWDPDINGVAYSGTTAHQKFQYVDSNGIVSTFFVPIYYDDATPCNYSPVGPQSGGYPVTSSGMYFNPADGTLTLPNGEVKSYFSAEDTNGNIAEWYGSWRDSVGRYILYSNGMPTTTYKYTDSNGTQQTVTETLQSFNLKTNFGCPGITTEYSRNSVNLPVSIALPNGRSYTIEYEDTPGYSGYKTGRISKITLPDGGYISYQYTGPNDGISCSDGSTLGLKRIVSDGTNSQTWQYSRSCNSTCTLTETLPTNDQTVDTFGGGELIEEDTYQGSATGTPLEKVVTTWDSGGTPHTRTITLANGQESQVTTNYGYYGNLLETDETDWGSGAPGPLLRKTVNTYDSDAALVNLNIVNRLQSTVVYDGSGNIAAQTQYEYDNYTAGIAASGAIEHDSAYGTGYTTRGNVTAVKRWRKSDGAWLTTRLQYDDAGNVLSSTDPQGSTTSFSYADSWGEGTCTPSGGNGAAYVTSVTNALGQSSHATYNSCTGTVASTTDANGQRSTFSYDLFGRPKEKDSPDGGVTTMSYDDTGRTVTTNVKLNTGGATLSSISTYDGLGRTTQTKVTSDPAGSDITDTVYDPLGRVYSVSNPYRSTGDSTYGVTHYQYDALGRPTQVTDPDNNTASSTYSGNCVTVTDEQGKDRKSCTNGLGQLTQVFENPSGANFETDYIHDALGDLTSVVEAGGRPRTFAYDSLGRLTQTINPESGTVNYVYDADPNCGAPNSSAGDLISKTDARGIRTCLQYDALHRLTQKNYSDGSPSDFYWYDQSSVWGIGLTNPAGRLTEEATYSGAWTTAAIFGYDSMGRIINDVSNIGSSYPEVALQYDLAGDLTQLTYPDGRVVTQAYDAGANLTQVQFASINGTPVGYNYFSNPSYAANGAPLGWTLGNGVTETQSYNNRWQPVNHIVSNPNSSARLLDRTYSFYDQSTPARDDGNVMSITDNLNAGRSLSFGYDALSRVTSAQTAATSGADCWGQSYVYDKWGNLTQETPTQCATPQLDVTATAANQLSATGVTYDAAGNTSSDGTHNYSFDAEGNLTQVDGGATAAYVYNAEGQRVQKAAGGATTQYVYFGGAPIAEYNVATGGWSDYIFANGQRIARADTYEDRVHTFGNNCSDCGWQWSIFWFGSMPVDGHVIQPGDKLYLRQWQSSGARGGPGLWFTDGSYTGNVTSDQDGELSNADTYTNEWHYRVIDLSSEAGKTVSGAGLITEGYTAPGAWDIYYNDVVLVGADGTVFPIYDRQPSVGFTVNATDGSTRGYEVNHWDWANNPADVTTTTTYYSGDQLGSARMMTSENGYPVWSGEFLPFGQEWNAQATVNHYKFTGQERDAETGMDYYEARHYTSQYGRFLQPDPAGMAAVDPSNPQSWNQYAYVFGNPLNLTDPTGMVACQWWKTTYTNGSQDGPPTPDGITDCGDFDEGAYLNYLAAISNGVSPFGLGFNPCMTDATLNCGNQSGGGDPKAQQIEAIRLQLVTTLTQDPGCLAFLGHSGSNVLGTLKTIPITHADIGWPQLQASTTATTTSNPFINSHPRITINDDGYFFDAGASYMGMRTGTPRFQALVLLHELGHATNVLLPDANSTQAEQHNNAQTLANCGGAIGSLPNSPAGLGGH